MFYLYKLCHCLFSKYIAMHILMADDDKDDFFILKEAAKKTGEKLEVSYAGNWIELVAVFFKKTSGCTLSRPQYACKRWD